MSAPFVPSVRTITPRGILSFGPDAPPLELRPLNVLIGPNASGKSNLIDLLRLVRSLPSDMQAPNPRRGRHRRMDLEGVYPEYRTFD